MATFNPLPVATVYATRCLQSCAAAIAYRITVFLWNASKISSIPCENYDFVSDQFVTRPEATDYVSGGYSLWVKTIINDTVNYLDLKH